jgi:hypothetical protein
MALLYIYDFAIDQWLVEICLLNLAIFKGFLRFSGHFFAICAAIVLTLCTWLYIFDLQTKFKDGCYQPILERVMPLEHSHFKGFLQFSRVFSKMCAAIALKLCTCVYINQFQNKVRR